MCMLINKEKLHLELYISEKLRGNVRWRFQNISRNELVSPSAARWHDQHALPPLEGADMRISSFKLSKVECWFIKLQIDFLLDRGVTCNNKMLYHQRSPKIPITKGGI